MNLKTFINYIGLITFLIFIIVPLKAETVEEMSIKYDKKYPNIKHTTVKKYLKNKDTFILVDIRPKNEQKVSVIPNSISYKFLEENLEKFKDKNLIIYCTIGERSSKYTKKLIAKEFANVANLRGGVLSWAKNGEHFIDPKGNKTYRVHVYGKNWNVLPKGYIGVW